MLLILVLLGFVFMFGCHSLAVQNFVLALACRKMQPWIYVISTSLEFVLSFQT